jgi:two-component system phosphate regulon sensor histidine kinase PhoR
VNLTQRLVTGSLMLVSALVIAVVVIAGSRLEGRLTSETRKQLQSEARLIALQWQRPNDADAIADAAATAILLGNEGVPDARRAIGRRVTLIDTAGVVLGDSEFDGPELLGLENHRLRPEVNDAARSGVGCDSRLSASAGDEEMYCAVRHPLGFVRVSIATSRFHEIVRSAQGDVLRAAIIALLGATLLALVFSRTVSKPIVELRDVARAIAGGDLARRPALSAPGEVGDLAVALHRMAEQLGARLQAVEREEALMLAVIESLDEGIVAATARGEVVRLNAAARRLLGIRAEPPFHINELPPERVLRDAVRLAMAGDATESAETVIGDRTLVITARPLPDGGAVLAVMDLTARRRLETIRRDFVANVSHELKTPLTVISGFAETLRDGSLPDNDRALFIDKILGNTTRMQRIVDDLLDLSRYESGRWSPRMAPADIRSIVTDVFATVQSEAQQKGITLGVSIDPSSARVRADPTALRQILGNLIENAVRHTADGEITVGTARDPAGRGVWIAVRDTGTGIPQEHLPRIFERFYRVDAGRSRDAGGTGLGLAIVKHLAEAHGGTVQAESTVGRGTTISVLLPASEADRGRA